MRRIPLIPILIIASYMSVIAAWIISINMVHGGPITMPVPSVHLQLERGDLRLLIISGPYLGPPPRFRHMSIARKGVNWGGFRSYAFGLFVYGRGMFRLPQKTSVIWTSAMWKWYAISLFHLSIVLLPVLLIAIWRLVRWWRRRGVMGSLVCDKCGYDLRGNTSGKCPECGNNITIQQLGKIKMLNRSKKFSTSC